MIKYYRAQINWIIPENGGRKRIPPKGTKYTLMKWPIGKQVKGS